MPTVRLTQRTVDTAKAEDGPVFLWDATLRGFGVKISRAGSKTYLVQYRPGGRETSARRYVIGKHAPWTLAAARRHAEDVLRAVSEGRDPYAERIAAATAPEVEEPPAETYEQAVEDYIKRFQIGQKGNASASEVRRVLLKEGAEWRSREIAGISARDVRQAVELIRDGVEANDHGDEEVKPRPTLANRFFSYLRTFFAWCAEPGIEKVEHNPMVGLKRPWDGESERNRVFDDGELKALWQAADALWDPEGPPPAADATVRYQGAFLRCLLILGKRKSTLASMRHDEIDKDGVWRPPQDSRRRVRTKRAHAVPLPPVVREIIEGLPKRDGNPFVFVGRRKGGHIDPGSPLQRDIQLASGVGDFFYHATRHTVETRLAELQVPPHVRDLILDHAPARGSGAGYDHYGYVKEMRAALTKWADHIAGLVPSTRYNVVELTAHL